MRNIIDEAIGASPVSTVDVDGVVAAGRRRTGHRRLATVGAGIGTLAVVGIVAALALTSGLTPTPAPTQAQPAASPDGSAPLRDGETPEQAEQRLVAALTEGLTAALPGVQLSDGPTGQPGVALFVGANPTVYSGDIVLTTAAGEGEVFFESWPGGQPASDSATRGEASVSGSSTAADGSTGAPVESSWIESCADLSDTNAECEEFVGPGGQKVVVVTAGHSEGAQGGAGGSDPGAGPGAEPVDTGQSGEISFHYAYVTWTNARVLMAIASDLKRGEPGPYPGVLLLTGEQLADIAMDPDLTVAS